MCSISGAGKKTKRNAVCTQQRVWPQLAESSICPNYLYDYPTAPPYLPIYLSTHLPICPYAYLPISRSTYLPTYLPISLSTHLPIYPSTHSSTYPLSQCAATVRRRHLTLVLRLLHRVAQVLREEQRETRIGGQTTQKANIYTLCIYIYICTHIHIYIYMYILHTYTHIYIYM